MNQTVHQTEMMKWELFQRKISSIAKAKMKTSSHCKHSMFLSSSWPVVFCFSDINQWRIGQEKRTQRTCRNENPSGHWAAPHHLGFLLRFLVCEPLLHVRAPTTFTHYVLNGWFIHIIQSIISPLIESTMSPCLNDLVFPRSPHIQINWDRIFFLMSSSHFNCRFFSLARWYKSSWRIDRLLWKHVRYVFLEANHVTCWESILKNKKSVMVQRISAWCDDKNRRMKKYW